MKTVKLMFVSLVIALIALPITTMKAQKKDKAKHKKYGKYGKGIAGNGNVVSEDRKVANFTKLSVESGMDVYITQGSPVSVRVKADANLQEYIETEVKGNMLKVRASRYLKKAAARKVYVTVPDLKAITASGGSDIYAQKGIKTDKLSLIMSGGCDLELEMTARELSCVLSGGSDVELSGSVGTMSLIASGGSDLNGKNLNATDCKINVSGGSDVDISGEAHSLVITASGGSDLSATHFQVKKCKINVSGGSDASIKVSDELSMTASGASDIDYYGNPKITHKKVSKSCDVTQH